MRSAGAITPKGFTSEVLSSIALCCWIVEWGQNVRNREDPSSAWMMERWEVIGKWSLALYHLREEVWTLAMRRLCYRTMQCWSKTEQQPGPEGALLASATVVAFSDAVLQHGDQLPNTRLHVQLASVSNSFEATDFVHAAEKARESEVIRWSPRVSLPIFTWLVWEPLIGQVSIHPLEKR